VEQNLQDAYKPMTLLQWRLRPLNFYDSRFAPPETKITKCRALRSAANRLVEFEKMTFAEISDELDALDRESREQALQVRKIGGGEQVLTATGN
jgi:hypothetical protein